MKSTPFTSTVSSVIAPQYPTAYERGMQRIALPYLNRTVFISVDDILCLQGEGNYTYLCTRDRKKYLVSKTLKEFERTLDESIFLRIHKSYCNLLRYPSWLVHLLSPERLPKLNSAQ